ncbi:ABC transporter substrate-binding protein [Falsirhodobacter sp. 20TX0035]|uniref:ABC transporter substrate-binding protein n=1 Tax=Falsirhodobacter sp. 20TX0035 TaxID=3022019 RepID=UPI00232F2450|nr:ABC transporter substrate-binding protein [Falsirhodobacter sp. 20TX0035]MDB6453678.1 ABC transporter substrate-binding protein [Falsirhodobacter sp. 20TX0035]
MLFNRYATGIFAVSLFAASGAIGQDYKEAPQLLKKVEENQLPPVAERLPVRPEVVTPIDSVGRYGGSLKSGIIGASDQSFLLRWIGAQGFVRRSTNFDEIVPNLAETYQVSDDNRLFTFTLREGLHWSDGTPMTTEDVRFAMEDVMLNSDLGAIESRYVAGGTPVRVEIVDDRTVTFTFDQPNAMFLIEMTRWEGQSPVYYPKHYCSQFHADHNPDVMTLAAQGGYADWQSLFAAKCGGVRTAARFMNIERPVMDPWVITAPYNGGATRVTYARNPYFWQVDTEGNQPMRGCRPLQKCRPRPCDPRPEG